MSDLAERPNAKVSYRVAGIPGEFLEWGLGFAMPSFTIDEGSDGITALTFICPVGENVELLFESAGELADFAKALAYATRERGGDG